MFILYGWPRSTSTWGHGVVNETVNNLKYKVGQHKPPVCLCAECFYCCCLISVKSMPVCPRSLRQLNCKSWKMGRRTELIKQQKVHQKQISELEKKICEQEKKICEQEIRLRFLEEKKSLMNGGKLKRTVMTPNVDASKACAKCPDRFFLSTKGLFRHIVDKHTDDISQDTIFRGPSPNLNLAPATSPPAHADLSI